MRTDTLAPRLRVENERVEPTLRRERFGCEAAQLAELCDHVRLVRVPKLRGDARPPNAATEAGVCEPRMEPRELAVALRTYPDHLTEHACEMLPRHACRARKATHRHRARLRTHPTR